MSQTQRTWSISWRLGIKGDREEWGDLGVCLTRTDFWKNKICKKSIIIINQDATSFTPFKGNDLSNIFWYLKKVVPKHEEMKECFELPGRLLLRILIRDHFGTRYNNQQPRLTPFWRLDGKSNSRALPAEYFLEYFITWYRLYFTAFYFFNPFFCLHRPQFVYFFPCGMKAS